MQIFTQKKFKGEILMYIPNIQVMPLVQKGKKINSLMEEKSMITQNSTATINNLDGTYITVLMAQLVWAPFPTDSKSESERNNFCNHFEKICETLTEKCSQDDEDALVVYDSIPKYARYHLYVATNEPGYFKPINFLDIVRKNWDVLESESATYEALISLVKLMADYITGYELYLTYYEKKSAEVRTVTLNSNDTPNDDDFLTDLFN